MCSTHHSIWIQIHESAFHAAEQHCRSEWPLEGCSLLFGAAAGEDPIYMAKRFVPVSNIAPDPLRHFLMCPKQMTKALLTAKSELLVGIVHSHPSAEAIPSAMDVQTQWHTVPSHWIFSFMPESKNHLLVFQIESGQWRPIPWNIIKNYNV